MATRTTAARPATKTAAKKPARTTSKPRAAAPADSAAASAHIDGRIAELDDWRGEVLSRIRALIKEAIPGVVEEWKWSNPVWSHHGIICTGESYKKAVKMTFPKGAALPDPAKLFNSSLDGNVRRAIDVSEGAALDETALKALFLAAGELNAMDRVK